MIFNLESHSCVGVIKRLLLVRLRVCCCGVETWLLLLCLCQGDAVGLDPHLFLFRPMVECLCPRVRRLLFTFSCHTVTTVGVLGTCGVLVILCEDFVCGINSTNVVLHLLCPDHTIQHRIPLVLYEDYIYIKLIRDTLTDRPVILIVVTGYRGSWAGKDCEPLV